MGTNTENGIQIFNTTIRIYSNILFGRSCLWIREIVSLSGQRTYLDTGNVTVHNQFEVRKVLLGISINYLELSSLYMSNCFLTTCIARRRHSICKFKFGSVCKTRCQHKSIDSIGPTKIHHEEFIRHGYASGSFCTLQLFHSSEIIYQLVKYIEICILHHMFVSLT